MTKTILALLLINLIVFLAALLTLPAMRLSEAAVAVSVGVLGRENAFNYEAMSQSGLSYPAGPAENSGEFALWLGSWIAESPLRTGRIISGVLIAVCFTNTLLCGFIWRSTRYREKFRIELSCRAEAAGYAVTTTSNPLFMIRFTT